MEFWIFGIWGFGVLEFWSLRFLVLFFGILNCACGVCAFLDCRICACSCLKVLELLFLDFIDVGAWRLEFVNFLVCDILCLFYFCQRLV